MSAERLMTEYRQKDSFKTPTQCTQAPTKENKANRAAYVVSGWWSDEVQVGRWAGGSGLRVSVRADRAGGDQNSLQQPADDRKSSNALVQSGLVLIRDTKGR